MAIVPSHVEICQRRQSCASECSDEPATRTREPGIHHVVKDRAERVGDSDSESPFVVGRQLTLPDQDLFIGGVAAREVDLIPDERATPVEAEEKPAEQSDFQVAEEDDPILIRFVKELRELDGDVAIAPWFVDLE